GALGSASIVRAVAKVLADHVDVPAVIDTPMAATLGKSRGARLLATRALSAMRSLLVPRAAILTVNVAEAEALTKRRVFDLESARVAATELRSMGARVVIVKGGHLEGPRAI